MGHGVAPSLTIPFLTGLGDLRRCVASIDTDVDLLVIDNSDVGIPDEFPGWHLPMPTNVGVAASWNLAITLHPADRFWLIANHDTVFGPGDLARLAAEVDTDEPRWVGVNGDWRVMGLNAACVERVGFFDPSFHPIYAEDCDYEYRCTLAGVPWYFIPGGATHVGSASIKEPRYGEANRRTYPLNLAYYAAKWGGHPRGGERFTTPFDRGGSVRDWTLDIARLRDNAW